MNKPKIMTKVTVVPHFSVLRRLLPFNLIPANVLGVFILRTSTSLVPAWVRAGRARARAMPPMRGVCTRY
jgi:hypothetical protein